MSQSNDEILDELRNYVAGRGNDTNFCYSKRYSPKSYIRCVDFSPWVRKKLFEKDIYALAVFEAQLSKDAYLGAHIPFERDVYCKEVIINNVLKFPFDEYFTGDFRSAKIDIIITWLLHYPQIQFSKILMAYRISLKNAEEYIRQYNRVKETQVELPNNLPNDNKFSEFQQELRKLPLATRLHLFDILEYSGFSKKKRLLSDMTLFDTRYVGIDQFESANILCQSKLIASFPDGTGCIIPEFADVVSIAASYATKIAPAYREWHSDVVDKLKPLDIEGIISLWFMRSN